MMTNITVGTLFEIQIDDKTKEYGTFLAIKNDGQYVFEMKNDNTYKAFDKSQCAEVLPYTFGVQFEGKGSKVYHFIGKVEGMEIGSVLIRTDYGAPAMCVVAALNTKSKMAAKSFKGMLLTDTIINIDEDD